jgi:anti-sigma regulatory factor (Ser/Thr protein kinase)
MPTHTNSRSGEMNSEARLALRPVPASAAMARQFVDDTLRGWGCDAFVDASRLLVSELVTNAVLHARTDMTLVIRLLRDGVRVEVTDASPVAPVVRNYEDEAMTGRGLSLVNDLAVRWGVEPEGSGKTVWFELAT